MARLRKEKTTRRVAFTFPFGGTNRIRFKGYYLSPLKDTPKVGVNVAKVFLN